MKNYRSSQEPQIANSLHIIASMASAHGGPTRTVNQMTAALAKASSGSVGLVYCTHDGDTPPRLADEVLSYEVKPKSKFDALLGLSFRSRLKNILVEQSDPTPSFSLLHTHGLWRIETAWAARLARACRLRLVVQPRGMLEPWALNHKRLKKQVAWFAYEHQNLNTAALFVATSTDELGSIRALGFKQPIAVIPNGVDLQSACRPAIQTQSTVLAPRAGYRRALFLSRIHPKKGLVNLINSWGIVRPTLWKLTIVGPDEGDHLRELKQLVKKLQLDETIEFQPELDDTVKWQAYRESDLFVLPSFSENFGVVVAEALSMGLPVITTKGTPWRELEKHSCGWWIDIGIDPLVKALRHATGSSRAQLADLSGRARQLAENYDQELVGTRLMNCYAWLVDPESHPRPSYVDTT